MLKSIVPGFAGVFDDKKVGIYRKKKLNGSCRNKPQPGKWLASQGLDVFLDDHLLKKSKETGSRFPRPISQKQDWQSCWGVTGHSSEQPDS
jgi:hypothetical protein